MTLASSMAAFPFLSESAHFRNGGSAWKRAGAIIGFAHDAKAPPDETLPARPSRPALAGSLARPGLVLRGRAGAGRGRLGGHTRRGPPGSRVWRHVAAPLHAWSVGNARRPRIGAGSARGAGPAGR